MKKLVSLFLALMIVFALAVCPMTASAIITTYSGTFAVLPGNTRSSSPVYNYAWLDNIIVRDDAMAVTAKAITPKPTDYPGSHTYDEFIKEAKQYETLFYLDENTVAAAYEEINYALYYLVTAAGMTGELDDMRQYLSDYGIRLPGNEDAADKAAIAVTYAVIKYDAIYALYEKKVEIPKGTTLDGATVIVISALTNTMLPSGVDTLTGMAVNMLKQYVTQFKELPITQNPAPDEVFYWAKILTAAGYDYQVPLGAFDETTTAQKEYVDYAYYASILNTMYDITVNPIKLIIATQSNDELALQKLIMQTMLDEKGVAYNYEMSAKELFDLASANGCFALEDELYSDVLTYELTVAEECTNIWFTPFTLADQLEGGNSEYVTIKLNDTEIKEGSTTSVKLYPSLRQEKVLLSLNYNDGKRNDSAVYEFIIKKDAALNDENAVKSENDMVAEVEKFLNTIVPDQNSAAAQKIDTVLSAIDQKAQEEFSTTKNNGDILTTYDVNTTYNLETSTTASENTEDTDRFDFNYLEDLINGVYETDAFGNIVTTTSLFSSEEETEDQSVFEKAAEAVKENPEIVVAPTGIVTLGSLAGYFLSKKHRDSFIEDEEEETEE